MLVFTSYEKNLFGQVRSWSASVSGGRYVISKAPNTDRYQAEFQDVGMKPVLLQKGDWLPSFERAKTICNQDASTRQRARIVQKFRQRPQR
jgi:hypothetical protein